MKPKSRITTEGKLVIRLSESVDDTIYQEIPPEVRQLPEFGKWADGLISMWDGKGQLYIADAGEFALAFVRRIDQGELDPDPVGKYDYPPEALGSVEPEAPPVADAPGMSSADPGVALPGSVIAAAPAVGESAGMTKEQAKEIWQRFMRFQLRYPKSTFATFAAEDDDLGRPKRDAANKLRDQIFDLTRPKQETAVQSIAEAFAQLSGGIQSRKGLDGHRTLSNNAVRESKLRVTAYALGDDEQCVPPLEEYLKAHNLEHSFGGEPDEASVEVVVNSEAEGIELTDQLGQWGWEVDEVLDEAVRIKAGSFYIMSDRGALMVNEAFDTMSAAKKWWGEQSQHKGRLGIGLTECNRYGQAVREGSELTEATTIDTKGLASDKMASLSTILKSHGVEHTMQDGKVCLPDSQDAHFVVDAMADIEGGHTPPEQTEAGEGDDRVEYIDFERWKTDAEENDYYVVLSRDGWEGTAEDVDGVKVGEFKVAQGSQSGGDGWLVEPGLHLDEAAGRPEHFATAEGWQDYIYREYKDSTCEMQGGGEWVAFNSRGEDVCTYNEEDGSVNWDVYDDEGNVLRRDEAAVPVAEADNASIPLATARAFFPTHAATLGNLKDGQSAKIRVGKDTHTVTRKGDQLSLSKTEAEVTEAEGGYEVAYTDNNGKMKRKSFKSDAAREAWIDKQGSDITVDSYRDPEGKSEAKLKFKRK